MLREGVKWVFLTDRVIIKRRSKWNETTIEHQNNELHLPISLVLILKDPRLSRIIGVGESSFFLRPGFVAVFVMMVIGVVVVVVVVVGRCGKG